MMDTDGFNFESELNKNIDFTQQCLNHLEFLKLIDQTGVFYEGETLNQAIYRYERVWIPFCIALDSTISENWSDIFPPLDIAWVWHCHMLSSSYFNDLKSNYGKIIDHFCIETNKIQQKQSFTKQLWQNFTQINFDYENKNCVDTNYLNFKSNFLSNLIEISAEQKNFFYQVSQPHFKCKKFLQIALKKYKKFILLKKKFSNFELTSCYAIDIVWRTHQLNPSSFYSDMRKIFSSKSFFFCPYSNYSLKEMTTTAKLWREEFNEDMLCFGCVYRGPNISEFDFHPSKNDIDYYMDRVAHIEFWFQVEGKTEENDDYLFEVSIVDQQEENILGDINTTSIASFSRTIILKDYEPKLTLIKITLKPKANRLKTILKSSNLLNKNFKQFFQVDINNLQKFKKKLIVMPIYLNSQKTFNLKLNLILTSVRNELNFGLKKNPFKYVKLAEIIDNYKSLFDLNESFIDFDQVLKANHVIKAIGSEKDVFQVEVLHMPSIFWSSVKVLNENKTVCTAHILDSRQMPRTDFVQNPDIGLEPNCGKAILIRDWKGDFALIIGKWTVKKDMSRMNSLLISIVFLRDTRPIAKIEINENFKTFTIDGKSRDCFYGAHLDKGLVWLNTSECEVEKFDWSIENHLAIVFSISVLYALTSSEVNLYASSSESHETDENEFSSAD